MTKFLQTLVDSLTLGSLYSLIALGYTLVYGVLQFINFAHGDVFMLGAWLSLTIAVKLGWGQSGASPIRAVVIVLAAMVLCGSIGYLIERLAYRPLRKAARLNVLITAIGVSLFLENLGAHPRIFGTQNQHMPELLPGTSVYLGVGVMVPTVDLSIIAAAIMLMIALDRLVFGTRIGLAMRAVSFDSRTAALMGVPVNRIISTAFITGATLAGGAGFLYAAKFPDFQQPSYATWTLLGLKAFVAAVVGGIGNVRGAMLGGLLIGLLESFGAAYLSPQLTDVYVFALLILVLLVRPAGLLGRAVAEKV